MGPSDLGSHAQFLLGTGARMQALARVLTPEFTRATVRSLARIDDLEDCAVGSALVLDADTLVLEDLGYLRRLLERKGVDLRVTGSDPSQRAARSLLQVAGARWMCWPPNLDELLELSRAPRALEEERRPVAASDAQVERDFSTEDAVDQGHASHDGQRDEIEAIERVLGMRPAAPRSKRADASTSNADTTSRAPSFEPSFAEMPATAIEMPPEAELRTHKESNAERALPHAKYFRHQVADLADLAQRIDLTFRALTDLRGDPSEPPQESATESSHEPWNALGGDVARLVQFTRTLGYLAAPPPPGAHVFDLSEIIEWCVSSLVNSGPRAPRGLFRTTGPLRIRSDRALLAQAFDAIFFLAQSASAAGEIVRVELSSYEVVGHPMARVSIQFPAGPLQALKPAQILEPYALRRIFPDLGPNALSAAVSIIDGQGGSAVLEELARARLQWVITLPREPDLIAEPSAADVTDALGASTSSPISSPIAARLASTARGDAAS